MPDAPVDQASHIQDNHQQPERGILSFCESHELSLCIAMLKVAPLLDADQSRLL
jgi:hypothetical protein